MELVKDIYFNTDKLIENTKVKVSYTGKFYQGNNEKVYIHYGYGKNWNNINEVEMVKTDLGYQTELTLVGGDTLNFCFKNQNNEWDNNYGKNYVFNIEKTTTNGLGKTTVGTKEDNVVYWGKTYTKNKEHKVDQKAYWTLENIKNVDSYNSNVEKVNADTNNAVTTAVNNTPQSVDTVITNGLDTISQVGTTPQFYSDLKTTIENDSTYSTSGIGETVNYNGIANSGTETVTVGASQVPNTEISLNGYIPTEFNEVEVTATPNVLNTVGSVTTVSPVATNKVENATATNIVNPVKTEKETAIILAPTGFNYWTKKIKHTVFNFLTYVPKLISGNYKRNLSNKNKKES